MEITTTQLNYLFACYSLIFSAIGLYFFAKASTTYNEIQSMIEDFCKAFEFADENIKHEGTDAD